MRFISIETSSFCSILLRGCLKIDVASNSVKQDTFQIFLLGRMTAHSRKAYPTDLSDAQWALVHPLLPRKVGKGRNQAVSSARNRQRHFLLAPHRLPVAESAPRLSTARHRFLSLQQMEKERSVQYAGRPIVIVLDNARYQHCKFVEALARS